MALLDIIAREIAHNGPMDVGAFMMLALGHPRFGYYMNRDPLGASGDFTTAPEVSQMFGELVGAWAADQWQGMGAPISFTMAEAGPGRGTLMSDLLRATRGVPGFHDSLSLHLLETSPTLRERQADVLKGWKPAWHDDPSVFLESGGGPLIMVANEFLDALPIRQLQKEKGRWQERRIGIGAENTLVFGLGPTDPALTAKIPDHLSEMARDGDIYEIAPARSAFMEALCEALRLRGGAALLIDYGHSSPGLGDTLQAIKNHGYVPVLEEPGQVDLTAHVDFSALMDIAHRTGCETAPVMTQGEFLTGLGLKERAAVLEGKASAQQKLDIRAAVHRLADDAQMGKLFKVMVVTARI